MPFRCSAVIVLHLALRVQKEAMMLFFPAAAPQILHPSGSDVVSRFWTKLVLQVSRAMV